MLFESTLWLLGEIESVALGVEKDFAHTLWSVVAHADTLELAEVVKSAAAGKGSGVVC